MFKLVDPVPFTKRAPTEVIVRMESGEFVAVSCEIGVESHTGCPWVRAHARAVDAEGATRHPALQASLSHTSNAHEIAKLGGVDALKRLAVLAVLGEDTDPLWPIEYHATVREHWSIRTRLESAKHAGDVTDLQSILSRQG